MNNEILEDKYVLEYITSMINDSMMFAMDIDSSMYHHNTSYDKTPSLIKSGILSLNDLNKLGIIKYSDEDLIRLNDVESHVNGNDGVSLSLTGLDDLYADEEEYDPFNEHNVDFIISNKVRASRSNQHYGNEFISHDAITPDKFMAVDIRLLKYVNILKKKNNSDYYSLESAIKKYNCLQDISNALKQSRLDIPFREMSSDNGMVLDLNKIARAPKIIVKR